MLFSGDVNVKKHISIAVWLLMSLLAMTAHAMPRIDSPSGPLTRAETLKSLVEIASWLERTEALCANKDSSDCSVTLRVTVPATGGHPQCAIDKSAVQDESVRDIYCQVVSRALFPAKSADSAFSLIFLGKVAAAEAEEKKSAAASCGNPHGPRDDTFVAPCFGEYSEQLMGLYRQALQNHPDMRGVVVFSLQIRSSGIAYGVDIVSADPSLDADFLSAVTRLVKSMDFGVASADATVQHSFNFYP